MAVITKKDGRTIRTGKDYTSFRVQLWKEQRRLCIECGRVTDIAVPALWDDSFHVAHRGSRGMGAAIRDDIVGPNRGQVEGGLCGRCHRKQHNQ